MIYVHVPFCRSFCTYCGFYSERACPTEGWVDEVCREALSRRAEIEASSAVDTLYFGGGTPSVLPLSYLERIADACGGRSYREWTVEVNPDDITPEYAAGLRALGVNRVSMGVQSLDDGMLRWMNRRHSADGARAAFRQLRAAGFDNISVDVIFGISGLSDAVLEATLREIVEWRPEHVSAYQLSVEEGSALEALVRSGRYSELPDDDCSRQYGLICSILAAAGYEHYEISNWALPGRRALHNSAYWSRAPYVGLGPGAHSLRSALTTIPLHPQGTGGVNRLIGSKNAGNAPEIRSWNSEALSGWKSESEVLTEEQVREERIMLGLRTAEGVDASLVGHSGNSGSLVPSGVPGRVRIPEDKWFVADSIIAELI
ncbi:MAG: coproporphyrinogen III oxidase family protein [Bacteroidales bacterium]|nr:coproporphyrinogen III oxidase family protein [Bacteroidales bacterium]